MQLYNEEGEQVDAFTQEELDAKIAEKTTEFEAKEKELSEQLEKYKDKDFNFKALREAKDEQKEKMLAEMSDKEKKLFAEIEAVKNENEEFKAALTNSYKSEALAEVSTDEETQKKILANYERISDIAITKEQIKQKIREAYNMLGENEINPINAVSGTQSAGNIKKLNVDELTPELKEKAKEFGLSDEDIKKYDGK